MTISWQPAANSADVDGWATQVVVDRPAGDSSSGALAALRAKLGPDDPIAVLEAVGYTLDQLADGATYVWHRTDGALQGAIRPIASFRNDAGAVCRRLSVTLTLGDTSRWTDTVACREPAGRWVLGG